MFTTHALRTRVIRAALAALAAVAGLASGASIAQAQPQSQAPQASVALNVPQTITAAITPGSTQIELPFDLSGATALRLDLTVPVDGASFTLFDPTNAVALTSTSPGVIYTAGVDLIPGSTLPGGVFALPELPAPASGHWRLVAAYPTATIATVAFATVAVKTPFQAGIAIERDSLIVGEDVSVGLLLLNDGLPLNATFTAPPAITIEQKGVPGSAITTPALDDGAGADGLAGDGIFSIDHTFATAGTFVITGRASFNANGETVTREATRTVEVKAAPLQVAGITSSIVFGAGSCIAGLDVTFALDVHEAGSYVLAATLRASNGQTTTATAHADLQQGTGNASVRFATSQLIGDLGVDGPYEIAATQVLRVADDTFTLAHRGASAGQTPLVSLAQACVAAVEIEAALDVQPVLQDGFISALSFSFPIRVRTGGSYTVSFKIVGAGGQDIILIGEPRGLSAGRNVLTFTVPAARFLSVDGPYAVSSMLVVGPAGSASAALVGSSSAYQRWQFLPLINGDLDNDNDVDADDQAIETAMRNQTPLAPGDRRDLNRDGRIDILDIRLLTTLKCAAGTCPPR